MLAKCVKINTYSLKDGVFMKNKKIQKIIAPMLAFSILMSSSQIGSCLSPLETVCQNFLDQTKNGTNVFTSYFSQILSYMKHLEKTTGVSHTKEEIENVLKNSVHSYFSPNRMYSNNLNPAPKSASGVFSIIKSCLSSMAPFIAFGLISYVRQTYKNIKTKLEAGKIEKPTDPTSSMQLLNLLLYNLKGQEKAKAQIKSIVLNIVDKYGQFIIDKGGKRAGPGANVLYMTGPSGVGKSFSADIIRKVLSGFSSEPFVVEASDIDKQSKSSPVEQLFGMRSKRVSNGDVYEYSPIIQRLKSIPNTVFIINEVDKIWTPELEEKVRTIIDQGYINVNGEKIDCSAATFILTSNEISYSNYKNGDNVTDIDDGTGSRTFVKHDKSFLNRVKFIEFDNLSAADYKEIAMTPFLQLAARYKEQYGIILDLNGTIDDISHKVAELNRGARPIFSYIEDLNNKLLNEVVLRNLNSNNNCNNNYKVSFNKTSNEFVLTPIQVSSDESVTLNKN